MSANHMDCEQSEFIEAFLTEAREMLDEVEPLLIDLEKRSQESSNVDSEVINTIFRLFHSLKGAAGFLDMATVGKVSHEAETLLDLFRKGEADLSSEHIDLLNRTTDFIRNLLVSIEKKRNDHGFEDDADELIMDLKNQIMSLKSDKSGNPPQSNTKVKQDSGMASPSLNQTENPDDLHFEVSPDIINQFKSEAEELLKTAEDGLINYEKDPNNVEFISQAFRSLHSLKGNAGFLGYSDIEQLSHQSETVLDLVRGQKKAIDNETLTLLLEIIDFIRNGIKDIGLDNKPEIPGTPGLVSLLMEAAVKYEPIDKGLEHATFKASLSAQPIETDINPAGRAQSMNEPQLCSSAPETDTVDAMPQIEKIARDDNVTQRRVGTDRRSGEDRRVGARRETDKAASTSQTIRVDVEKLDILMDLVGELVISEALVSQNPDLKGLNIPLDRFEKSTAQLNKITRDLQDVAMSIRMISLSGTFRKMIRLTRDLSQKCAKKIDLKIIGEETEVDKTVIEQINDPLVHIIRNCIDHGLETPEEREKMGKPSVGCVTLEAKYAGGEVWISISDDGKGLNRDKILSKAREQALISGDGSELLDDDVWQIIFQPGFSTAEKVTDVSGRGVGMDVVRRNIENIRGKIEIHSKAGWGTTLILKIPLTLAIIDGMIVRVGRNYYIIPVIAIRESLKPEQKFITHVMDGTEIINIRGQLLPVVRLDEIFRIQKVHSRLEDGTIIIIENEQKSMCLVVDEVIRQQQVVIKGLSNYVGNIGCISGCTILGDGDISLIIDVPGMFNFIESMRWLQSRSRPRSELMS